MRKQLGKLDGQRIKLTAVIDRFGTKRNYHGFPENTVCFKNVQDLDGNLLTDHIWFTVGKRIANLILREGERIMFEARVSGYVKGYYNDQFDYKLNNISRLQRA